MASNKTSAILFTFSTRSLISRFRSSLSLSLEDICIASRKLKTLFAAVMECIVLVICALPSLHLTFNVKSAKTS